jgi:uncharacterized protein
MRGCMLHYHIYYQTNRLKILFYFNHPAHFHLFKESIRIFKSKGNEIIIIIKKKDVLEDLLSKEGWNYYNVFPKERKNSKFAIAMSLIRRNIEVFKIALKQKPTLMIGTSVEITHIGKILRIPSIMVNEDDAGQIGYWPKISYPFASTILAPSSCDVGKWADKTIFYNGYHELAYLHPNYFAPNINNITELSPENKPYYIIRLSKLQAHHDKGKSGITDALAIKIIKKLKTKGNVFISSERLFGKELEKYRIKIHPSFIIDALTFATIYIGDSQTMAAEAATLGTPSIRFNDFVGKLGYLEELEHKYGLTYGIKTSDADKLLQKIDELLAITNLKVEWQRRRKKMLSDKIDVTAFFVWFVENYPLSLKIMKDNPNYQFNFI